MTVIALSRALELAISHTGLTPSKFRALSLIEAGATSGATLAKFLDVQPPTVTTVMNGLVTDGYATRVRSDDDRRRVDFELTDAGREVLETANATADGAIDVILGELDSDDDRDTARAGIDLWRSALDARRARR